MLKCGIRNYQKSFSNQRGCSIYNQTYVHHYMPLFKQTSIKGSRKPLDQHERQFTIAAVESMKAKKAMDWINSFLQKLSKSYIAKEDNGPTPFDIVDDDLKQLKI